MKADKSALWLILLLVTGGLLVIGGGIGNMGKGGTPKEAPFSASCEGKSGKWIQCSGIVETKERSDTEMMVTVRLSNKDKVSLKLHILDATEFEVGLLVDFTVKVNGGEGEIYKEVRNAKAIRDLKVLCTTGTWKGNTFDNESFGMTGALMIRVDKFPELTERGPKLIYTRSGEIARVVPHYTGRCIEGANLLEIEGIKINQY